MFLYCTLRRVKGRRCLASSQDAILPKTNRLLDEIKDGTRLLEDIEKPTNDLQVSSLPMSVSLPTASAVLFFFPLTHSLMVIYLVGKGSAFSPERSTTGREREPSAERGERREAEDKEKRNEEYIIHVCFPGDTRLSLLLSLTAVMGVRVRPQTEG